MAFLENFGRFQSLTQLIAAGVLLKFLWGCWNFIYVYCLGKYPDFHKYGKWSVVTGGTDGIGLAFVKKLAALGQNVVVISRNPEKVRTVATEVAEEYNVETKQIVVDFGHDDIYPKIKKDLKGLDVGTLVNNVGVASELLKFLDFADQPGAVENIIAVNIDSMVKMTQIVLPRMVEKRKGIVVNIGSGAGVCPAPSLSLYSSTKQFVDCFSKCLHAEYADMGIITQSIMPFAVLTKISKASSSNFFVLLPDKFASSALKTIGRCRRSYGCLSHGLLGKLLEAFPELLVYWLICRWFEPPKDADLGQRQSTKKSY